MEPWFDLPELGGDLFSATSPLSPSRRKKKAPDVPPELSLPEQGLGLLGTVGDIIDRPGNALRGVLSGNLGSLKGLIPFSETLGLFGAEDRVSGQDVLYNAGFINQKSDDLTSPEGAAGFAFEALADPLNLLGGAGALTKAGKAAKVVGGGLKQADKLAPLLKLGTKEALEEAALLGFRPGMATALDSPVAKAGKMLKGQGLPLELASDWGTAAKQGQRALLSAGGEFSPIPFMGPVADLPEAAWHAPEAVEAIGKAGQFLKGLPVVKQVGQLFSRTPAGLTEAQARIWRDEMEQARKLEQAGLSRAGDEAAAYEQALKDPALRQNLPPDMRGRFTPAVKQAGEFFDPETGELLVPRDPYAKGQEFDLAPEAAPPAVQAPPAAPVPGNFPNATNPEFIREQFAQERAGLLGPVEEAAALEERRLLERAKFDADMRGRTPYEQTAQPRPGHGVTFRPKDDVTGQFGRFSAERGGKVVAENADGTLTVQTKDGTNYILPADKVKRSRAKVYAEAEKIEYDALPPELRPIVKQQSADAREALRYGLSDQIAPEAAQRAHEFNREAKKARDGYLGKLGVDPGPTGQAQALPPAVEQALKAAQKAGVPPPELKTVEYLSADAAELALGDKLTIGGDVFEVRAGEPGMVKLKDGWEIDVPEQYVPKDKGSPIFRAGTGPEPGPLPPELQKLLGADVKRASDLPGAPPREALKPPEPRRIPGIMDVLKTDAERVLKEGTEAAAKRKADMLDYPPELQGMLKDLEAQEAAALERAAAKAPKLPEPTPQAAIEALPATPGKVRPDGPMHEWPKERLELLRKDHQAKYHALVAQRDELAKAGRALPDYQPFQEVNREIKRAERDLVALDFMIETGKPPKIPYGAGEAGVDRALHQEQWNRQVTKDQLARNYVNEAGKATAKAADEAAKLLPADADATVHRAITQALEDAATRGKAPEAVRKLVAQQAAKYQEMLDLEQKFAVPTPSLKDDAIDYTTRVATGPGKSYLGKTFKDPDATAKLFQSLQEARQAKGLPEDALAAAPLQEQRMAAGRPRNSSVPVQEAYRGYGKELLERVNPATRDWLERNGLVQEFLSFNREASTTHESMLTRLAAFRGLTIPELNEQFAKHGARSAVFNENPAAQLFARQARHVKVKAADRLFKGLAEGLGKEIDYSLDTERVFGGPMPGNPAVNVYKDANGAVQGYGLNEFNAAREAQGLKPVMFPNVETAEHVQKAVVKMMQPEEVQPLLKWYDNATRVMKSYVTKAFPAYHVRNRISNRMQSWLEDVPVAGGHYSAAQRVLAGQEAAIKLGTGETLNRAQMLEELTNQGIIKSGFFEADLKQGLGLKDAETWNPLDANNKLLGAAERVSSALADAPGRALSGAGFEGLGKGGASSVEGVDRAGHYLFKRAQGFSPNDAAASVKKALFDYSELNDFEKNVLARGMFFYTYSRNVIPFMLENLLQRPGKVRAMTQIGGGAGGQREGLPEQMPPWMREGLPAGFGKDEAGNLKTAYKWGTPIEAAADPFGGFADGFQRGGEKLLAQANPFLRIPLERATGKRFFLGRGIEESRKAPAWMGELPPEMQDALGVVGVEKKGKTVRYEAPPELLYWLENSPLGRLSTTVGKGVDARKSAADRFLNLITGSSVVSIDPEQQAEYALKDRIRARLKELEAQGKVQSLPELYALSAAGQQSEDMPEIQALLKASRKR